MPIYLELVRHFRANHYLQEELEFASLNPVEVYVDCPMFFITSDLILLVGTMNPDEIPRKTLVFSQFNFPRNRIASRLH
jgi:hypothetical protein